MRRGRVESGFSLKVSWLLKRSGPLLLNEVFLETCRRSGDMPTRQPNTLVLWQDPGQDVDSDPPFLVCRGDRRVSNIQKLSRTSGNIRGRRSFVGAFDRDWRIFVLVKYSNFLDISCRSSLPRLSRASAQVKLPAFHFHGYTTDQLP